MKVFITGIPGIGKTTAMLKLASLLEREKIDFAGFVTPDIRVKGKRIGFLIKDLKSGETKLFASKEKLKLESPSAKFAGYWLDLEALESIAVPILESSAKILLIDEIGKMELFSKRFKEALLRVLKGDKIIVATLHRKLVDEFRKYGEVIWLTLENRERIPVDLFNRISRLSRNT